MVMSRSGLFSEAPKLFLADTMITYVVSGSAEVNKKFVVLAGNRTTVTALTSRADVLLPAT